MIKLTSLFAVILLFIAQNSLAEPVVGFTKDKAKVSLGDTFTMNITISNVPNTEGGGLSLFYNPAVVQVLSVTVDEPTWDFATRNGDIDNNIGRVSDILFSSYGGVSNNADIAHVVFMAVGHGKSDLRLAESKVNPFASNGSKIAVSLAKAKVKVRNK